MNFDEYVMAIAAFRSHVRAPEITQTDRDAWRREWDGWTEAQRRREFDAMRSHMIVSGCALAEA